MRVSRSIMWAWIAQVLGMGGGILLLPLVLRKLETGQLAAWYVFSAFAALAQLAEVGFLPTLARNITYVFSGAQELVRIGIGTVSPDVGINQTLLLEIISATKQIYRAISAAAAVVLFVFGSWYMVRITNGEAGRSAILVAWAVYASGFVLNLVFGYYNALILGRERIEDYYRVTAYGRLAYIILAGVLVQAGAGILGIASAYFTGVLVTRFFLGRAIAVIYAPGILSANVRCWRLVKIIWHNSARMGVVMIGSFLINRANVLLIAAFLPHREVAAYGLVVQIFTAAMGLAALIHNQNLPTLNRLRCEGNYAAIREKLASGYAAAWVVFGTVAMCVLFFGNRGLALIGSKTALGSNTLVVAAVLVYFLEMNHSIASSYLTCKNDVEFVKAAIASGIANVALCFLVLKFTSGGALAVICCQGVVQACYNNWKWPARMLSEVESNFWALARLAMRRGGASLRSG